jgi:hypothetical protein
MAKTWKRALMYVVDVKIDPRDLERNVGTSSAQTLRHDFEEYDRLSVEQLKLSKYNSAEVLCRPFQMNGLGAHGSPV